jgi:recombination protein RecR
MLRTDRDQMSALGEALIEVAEKVHECDRCCAITADAGLCATCRDAKREASLLCVVATIQDQAAIEATGAFRGRYHVLHGTLSPLDGIGPDELRIQPLMRRLAAEDREVEEVILATPPTVDGEATALFLARQLEVVGLRLSRIASGVPVGGDLQFTDKLTLAKALAGRLSLSS